MWMQELTNGKFKFNERYIDPETGKYKTVSLTVDKNTASIRKEMPKLLQEKIEKKLVKKEKINSQTFKDVSEQWLSVYKTTVKLSTLQRVEFNLKALNEFLANTPFEEIQSYHFNSIFIDLQKKGRYTYASLKNMLSLIRMVIRYAYKYIGIDKMNIIPLLEVSKINLSKENEWKYLEKNELESLIEFLKTNNKMEYVRMVQIQTSTGMRFSEMVCLDFEEDINLNDNTIVVRHTYNRYAKILTTPKSGKERTIYFSDSLKPIIIEQINFSKKKILRHNISRKNCYLFITKNGYPYDITVVNKALSKFEIEGKKVTTHIFRHTFITRAVESGISKDLIAKQVGHADTTMIDKVYLHFTSKMAEQQKKAILDLKII